MTLDVAIVLSKRIECVRGARLLSKLMRFVVVVVLAFPAAAQSACPVATDLEKGVQITFSSGETERHFALPNGRMRVVWTEAGQPYTDIISKSGLSIAFWDGSSPSSGPNQARRLISDQITDTPPEVGGSFTAQGVKFLDGAFSQAFRFNVAWASDIKPMILGDCEYDVLVGKIVERDGDEDGWVMRFAHIPDLGVYSLIGFGAPGEPLTEAEVASISVLE